MIETKDFDNLEQEDIWTTDGINLNGMALIGKDGIVTDKDPFIFVYAETLPDNYFNNH